MVNIYEDKKADPEDTVPRDGVTQGEIIIYACEKSSLCYTADPGQTAEKYKDGWFYTKDVGTWDEKSYITVCGRKDDMIICMGENIYPAQLEAVLNMHPKVADSMVTGVKDPSRGESVAAYIVPADETLTVKEINHYCVESENIAGYMCPRYYRFVDSLPYNSTGKKQHVILKKMAAEDLDNGRLNRF